MSLADDKPAASRPSPRKKPYAPPRLIAYGHVKDIIQGGGGNKASDTGGSKGFGNSKKACWIAEALYGVEDPRTHLLRAWLSSRYDARRAGWPLIALYATAGRQVAALISRGLLPRAPFRLLFDALVERALDDSALVVVAARR